MSIVPAEPVEKMTPALKLKKYCVTIEVNQELAGFFGMRFFRTAFIASTDVYSPKDLMEKTFQKLVEAFEKDTGVEMEE